MPRQVVIIGGSDAGISAALRARQCDGEAAVTVVVADSYPNFSICGLPYYIGGSVSDWTALAHRTLDELHAAGLVLHLDTVAEVIDPGRQVVVVRDALRGRQELGYDRLVVATGAVPIEPPIAGLNLPGVFLLHTIDQGRAIRAYLERQHPRRAVVVGAGYIGLEMAEALTGRGMTVTLVEQASTVLPTVDAELGRVLQQYLAQRGVAVACQTRVAAIEATSRGLVVSAVGGEHFAADLVMVVTGVRPDSRLAAQAGVTIGVRGAVRVDSQMRTNLPGIFAAGDCVETRHRLLPDPVYLPLGTTAHKQGRVAGENAVGGRRQFTGSLGTQVVKVFEWAVARTGLREAEAAATSYAPVTVALQAWDHKGYYPGAERLHLRVTADRLSNRLLGAQILGPWQAAIAKRIDVMAVAVAAGFSWSDLLNMDLSYTPPLGTPWDAWQLAAAEGEGSSS